MTAQDAIFFTDFFPNIAKRENRSSKSNGSERNAI